jgi:hypothetical protein
VLAGRQGRGIQLMWPQPASAASAASLAAPVGIERETLADDAVGGGRRVEPGLMAPDVSLSLSETNRPPAGENRGQT